MTELREMINNVEVVGTIKDIDLRLGVSAAGKEYIAGRVDVEVREKDKINVITVRVFSLKLKKDGNENGLYKGYKTVMDEYNTGDKVRITGSLRLEEYYTQQGSLTSYNSVNALFFNRVDEGQDFKPKALATIEMVVEGFEQELDKEQLPSGRLEVEGFSVGYNGTVIPLRNMVISEQLGETFKSMYYPGTTGKITLKINNYAEVEEEEQQEDNATGFGSTERVEANVVTNFVNNLEIIGGDLPYNDGVKEYTPEMIEQAKKNRALVVQELQQQNMASSTPTGFGSASTESNKPVTVTEDDLPDF